MSKAAMAAEGLGRADFDKVYGARRMDEYQMNGFFPEPVQSSLKTASSQLPWPQVDGLVFNHLIDALQRNGMLSKRILGAMAATPKAAWRYAKIFLQRRWPEAEPAIAQDPKIAMWYATDVIQGPWPEAEPAIARGDWAEMYARQVLHLPYPQIRKWREHMLGHPA
jgi:hypothetical protein